MRVVAWAARGDLPDRRGEQKVQIDRLAHRRREALCGVGIALVL